MKILLKIALLLFLCILPEMGFSREDRAFDVDRLEKYRADDAFDYSKLSAQSKTLLDLVRVKIINFLNAIFGNDNAAVLISIIWRIALVAVIIAAVALILRLYFGRAITRNPTSLTDKFSTVLNEPLADFGKLYEEALSNKDHRLAIRFLFLKVLRDLDGNGTIRITDWKTTYDYQFEIPEGSRSIFKEANTIFEQAWFGQYPVSSADVHHIRSLTQKLTDV